MGDSAPKHPSVAILGAGLIGTYCGAFAQKGGSKVVFVGRPRIQKQVQENGIWVSTFEDALEFYLDKKDVNFVTDLPSRSQVGKIDYIIVCLKCGQGQTEEGAKTILASGHCDASLPAAERSVVVTFQNGARNPAILRSLLPEGTTVLAGSWPFNIAPGPRPGEFHQGVLGALKLEKAAQAEPLAQLLTSAGLQTDMFEDMEAQLVGKLITNANNAVNALSGLPLLAQLTQRDYRLVVVGTQKEALAVLEKAQIAFTGLPAGGLEGWFKAMTGPDDLVAKMIKVDAKASSSMADDIVHQRLTEIDELNGYISELGKKHGIPTPWNDTVISLVKKVEASYGPDFKPPAYSGKELSELCEAAAKSTL